MDIVLTNGLTEKENGIH
jgi:phage head maturation protease